MLWESIVHSLQWQPAVALLPERPEDAAQLVFQVRLADNVTIEACALFARRLAVSLYLKRQIMCTLHGENSPWREIFLRVQAEPLQHNLCTLVLAEGLPERDRVGYKMQIQRWANESIMEFVDEFLSRSVPIGQTP